MFFFTCGIGLSDEGIKDAMLFYKLCNGILCLSVDLLRAITYGILV